MELAAITLPGGLWRNGACQREAVLRPLTGEDELFLHEQTRHESPARRATALLGRCVVRLGPDSPPGREALRALTVGDREALLLNIRRLTFGEVLEGRLTCPACAQELNLNLRAADLLVKPYETTSEWHEAHEDSVVIRFRLPNGGDQEDVAPLATLKAGPAVQFLLDRCTEGRLEELSPELADRLSAQIAGLDPQAELTLHPVCPECGAQLSALLDVTAFLFAELDRHARTLLQQVHRLAFHYHWSEADLLALPLCRRKTYLEFIQRELDAGQRR
jgi:uncharacterized protein (UPF0212 family)